MSNKPNDGGPAFPFTGCGTDGMALRDYFAAKAMAGMLSQPGMTIDIDGDHVGINRAQVAYAMADAMLAARSNGGSEASDGHKAALENQAEAVKKLHDAKAAIKNLIDAQLPVSNTAFNLGQDSRQWKLINSSIDALDAAVTAAREVLK